MSRLPSPSPPESPKRPKAKGFFPRRLRKRKEFKEALPYMHDAELDRRISLPAEPQAATPPKEVTLPVKLLEEDFVLCVFNEGPDGEDAGADAVAAALGEADDAAP